MFKLLKALSNSPTWQNGTYFPPKTPRLTEQELLNILWLLWWFAWSRRYFGGKGAEYSFFLDWSHIGVLIHMCIRELYHWSPPLVLSSTSSKKNSKTGLRHGKGIVDSSFANCSSTIHISSYFSYCIFFGWREMNRVVYYHLIFFWDTFEDYNSWMIFVPKICSSLIIISYLYSESGIFIKK